VIAAVVVFLALTGMIEVDFVVDDGNDSSAPGIHRPLAVGDCVDGRLAILPCDQSHLAEVFLVTTWPGEASSPYPGARVLGSWVDENCPTAFESYVDVDRKNILYRGLLPTPESWASGDRELPCVAMKSDETPLRESVKGGVQ
jgi:hypothetical protein